MYSVRRARLSFFLHLIWLLMIYGEGVPVNKDKNKWGHEFVSNHLGTKTAGDHMNGLIAASPDELLNSNTDHNQDHKNSREERCRSKYLEPCRFRNPMNNDCGAMAIHYSWCIKGNKS
jgi:hypothetical protein